MISEGLKKEKPKKSYIRFQNSKTGEVVVANFKLGPKVDERLTYEFGYNKKNYATKKEAQKALDELRAKMIKLHGKNHQISMILGKAEPKLTQKNFDSAETMFQLG